MGGVFSQGSLRSPWATAGLPPFGGYAAHTMSTEVVDSI